MPLPLSGRGSSQPRGRTRISCIGRQMLYSGATGEALPDGALPGQGRKAFFWLTVEVHLWLVWERMGMGVEEGVLDKGKKSIVENQGPLAG